MLLLVEEIIEEISKNLKKSKPKSPNQVDMPLQYRKFREALVRVTETTRANVEGRLGNSNYWCIVSAGAPGIGGKDKLPFRGLHPGAYGTKNDLGIIMKLKELFVYEAREQFPLSLHLTLKSDGTKILWANG